MSRILREVAKLLTSNKDGLSTKEIAERLRLPIVEIRDILSELETNAVIYAEGNSKGGPVIWRLDQYALDVVTSDRFREKQRKCLCCREMFQSSHAGNRICPKCSTDKEEDHGFADDDLENLDWRLGRHRDHLKSEDNNTELEDEE